MRGRDTGVNPRSLAAFSMMSAWRLITGRYGDWVGSVSARASKYSWLDEGRDFSGGFQHTQDCCGAAKEVKSAVVGGHWLIGPGAGTEKVT
jgi:hypothetical protein